VGTPREFFRGQGLENVRGRGLLGAEVVDGQGYSAFYTKSRIVTASRG